MNSKVDALEDTARDVIAVQTRYPQRNRVATHTHRRTQLLYAASGTLQLETRSGTWFVPPGFAAWIPAGAPHRIELTDAVTRSLYFNNAVLEEPCTEFRVIQPSPLLGALIGEAIRIPLLYDRESRDGALIVLLTKEAQTHPAVPLHLPMPSDDRALMGLCQPFLATPNLRQTPAQWAARLHISERTFYRRFLARTGMSFMNWRRQACVLVAMSRLSSGENVTKIALDLGYESPSAFSTMFKKAMAVPPSEYIHRQQQ